MSSKTGEENKYRAYDAGQAAAYMTFQAMESGVFVHQMGGFDKQFVREAFLLADDIEPLTIMAAGFTGSPDYLPEKIRSLEFLPRTRKALQDLLLHDFNPDR
jgi:hypothetical protein